MHILIHYLDIPWLDNAVCYLKQGHVLELVERIHCLQ